MAPYSSRPAGLVWVNDKPRIFSVCSWGRRSCSWALRKELTIMACAL